MQTVRSTQDAREIGHAATLMYALAYASMLACIPCGRYAAAKAELDELAALAGEKGALFLEGPRDNESSLLAASGKASEAIELFTPGRVAYGSTGATISMPLRLPYLARAYARNSANSTTHGAALPKR